MADGFHSISDGASNIVGMIGIVMASKPKDIDHPYGHKKFETMLLFISFNVIKSSISKLFNPSTLEVSIESLIIILITLFINIFVASYENRQGQKLNSQLLIADSLHTKSDIFVSIGVLIALFSVNLLLLLSLFFMHLTKYLKIIFLL